MKRFIAYHTPGPEGGTWRFIENPTIGDVRVAREKGAIIARLVIENKGTIVTRRWVTTSGRVICERTDFL